MLKAGCIGMMISNIATGIAVFYGSNLASFFCFSVYIIWFQGGIGTLKWVHFTEICSINETVLVYMCYWGAITIFTCIFPFFYYDISYIIFFIFAISAAICFVITYFLSEINFGVPKARGKDWFDESFLTE